MKASVSRKSPEVWLEKWQSLGVDLKGELDEFEGIAWSEWNVTNGKEVTPKLLAAVTNVSCTIF